MQSERFPAAEETLDALFDGQLVLYQSRAGYRYSLDAVLLAHFANVKARDTVVDLGAGNGAITLMLAFLYPGARVIGVEIQPAMLERARRNVALNGLTERVSMLSGDVRAPATLGPAASFDLAVCNPPYRPPRSGRVSANPEKRIARHEFEGALEQFLQAANFLLRSSGRLALVYPAFRCVDALASLRAAGIEPKRLRMVHSFDGGEASLLLVEGIKGARGAMDVEAPLFIYDQRRRYRPEVRAMLSRKRRRSR